MQSDPVVILSIIFNEPYAALKDKRDQECIKNGWDDITSKLFYNKIKC